MSHSEARRRPPIQGTAAKTPDLKPGLASAAFTAGLCRVVSTGLSFVLLIVLTRLLGPAEYGQFIFLLSIGSALGLVFPLGQQILVLKHYRPNALPSENARLLHTNYVWMLRGFVVLAAAGGASIIIDDLGRLYAACLFGAVFALSEYFVNYFRLHGQMLLALVPRENAWRALTLLAIPAIVLVEPSLTGESAFLIATGLLLSMVAVQVTVFLRMEGLDWLRANRPNTGWTKESRYFIGSSVLGASSGYLDTIVIGTFVGLEEAAVYFTALRISKLLEIPKLILDTVGAPRVAQALQRGDINTAQHILRQMVVRSFLPTSIAAVAIYFLGASLLGVFDPSFVRGANVLAILVLVAVIQVAFGASGYTMKIGGGERTQFAADTALMCLYLVLLATLGLTLGLIGVAIANLLHVAARGLVASSWCQRHLSVNPTITSALNPTSA